MKAVRIAPIAMILTLALMALPAAAEHSNARRDSGNLVGLSQHLVRATHQLKAGASGVHFRKGHQRRAALWSLARLDRDAKRFRQHLRREGAYDRDTRRAFRRLEASFRNANENLPVVRARRGIRRDFARVAGLLAQLDNRMARIDRRHDGRRYGGRGDGWREGPRSDSNDRGDLAWHRRR